MTWKNKGLRLNKKKDGNIREISVKRANKKQRNTDGQRLHAGFCGTDSGSEGLGFESQRDHKLKIKLKPNIYCRYD
jgi:hypothetical protein